MFYFWGSLSKSKNKFEIWLGNDSIPLNNIKHQLPASSSTGLLQPLDTSAFSAFKHWIKRRNQQLRRTAQGGEALSFCGNWVTLLENFSPAENGLTLSKALGAGEMWQSCILLCKFHAESSVLPASCQTHSSRDDSQLAYKAKDELRGCMFALRTPRATHKIPGVWICVPCNCGEIYPFRTANAPPKVRSKVQKTKTNI